MKVKFVNTMVYARDFEKVLEWYQKALSLDIIFENREDYHYAELGQNKQVFVGIASATEMKHTPSPEKNNSTFLQIEVEDINTFFKRIKETGGTISFGVNIDVKSGLKYGEIKDVEQNQIWVIEWIKPKQS